MKIGLVGVTYKDNFGSVLQTYAMQYLLEKMGHEVTIFEIKGLHRSIKLRKLRYYATRLFDATERKYLIDNFWSRLRKRTGAKGDHYAADMAIRHQMYVDFYKKWLHISDSIDSWKDSADMARTMDAVVIGSDQLWRPSNIAGGFFTLEFVPDNVKKIAFSTSFGVSELPNNIKKHARSFLSRIEHISVREESGIAIVKELIGREIPVICDPTMMLTAEDWMHIQDENPFAEGKYILMYLMGDNPEQREFVKKLSKQTGCRIIGLLHGATYISYDEDVVEEKPYNVGPSEFINLIRNAEYVCTDSFHCCVFSILNSTKFFAFRRWPDGSQFSANDRLYTLLKFTGLENRLLSGTEDVKKCINDQIDFSFVLSRVAERRKMSMNYLVNALNT